MTTEKFINPYRCQIVAYWSQNPKELQVEMVDLGGNSANRKIPVADCCARLRGWFSGQKDILSDAERKHFTELIQKACKP